MKFFSNVTSLDELRLQFKKNVKLLHPDNGGNEADFKAMNNEYNDLFKMLERGYTQTKTEEQEQKKNPFDIKVDEALREILLKIINFDINIEIVGSWIWCDGNTISYKEALKEYGFKWSKARQKWHWSIDDGCSWYKGKKKDFNELRSIYGSVNVQNTTNYIG